MQGSCGERGDQGSEESCREVVEKQGMRLSMRD